MKPQPTYRQWLARRDTQPNRHALLLQYLQELRRQAKAEERRRITMQRLAVALMLLSAALALIACGILIGLLMH